MLKTNLIILSRDSELNQWIYKQLASNDNIDITLVLEENDNRQLIDKKIARIFKGDRKFISLVKLLQFSIEFPIIHLIKRLEYNYIKRCLRVNETSNECPNQKTVRVDSINNSIWLGQVPLHPKTIVLVIGTRIIHKEIIEKIHSQVGGFINWHIGLTPKYRGVQSELYCILNKDFKNFGITIHFIDEGIDSGKVLYQKRLNIKNYSKKELYDYRFMRAENIKLFIAKFPGILSQIELYKIEPKTYNLGIQKALTTPRFLNYVKWYVGYFKNTRYSHLNNNSK